MLWSLRYLGPVVLGASLAAAACTFIACSDNSTPPPNAQGGGGASGGQAGEGGMAGSVTGGQGGSAGSGGCTSAAECADGYACTVDECLSGVCSHHFDILSACSADQHCDYVKNACLDNPTCNSDADCLTGFGDDPCMGDRFCDLATHVCRFVLADKDADFHIPVFCGGDDCDDNAASVHPGVAETCDSLDNDCNGQVDDGLGINFHSPKTCGSCDNNCWAKTLSVDPAGISCDWNGQPGTPGICMCNGCASDWYSFGGNPCICDYYCIKTANVDNTCNNKDDDCDGTIDEDVNTCTSITDCGGCGRACVVLHGTPQCVHTGNMPCVSNNTQCEIKQCDPNWWDLDKQYATGCEYACTPSNGGVEACNDGLDNNCNGQIDEGC